VSIALRRGCHNSQALGRNPSGVPMFRAWKTEMHHEVDVGSSLIIITVLVKHTLAGRTTWGLRLVMNEKRSR
jgi:hypothetical protein